MEGTNSTPQDERTLVTIRDAITLKECFADAVAKELRGFCANLETDVKRWRKDSRLLKKDSAKLARLYADYVDIIREKLEELALYLTTAEGAS